MTISQISPVESFLATAGALLNGIGRMTWRGKTCLVAGGYVAAILLAVCAVACNQLLSGLDGSQESGGMQAFGDLLLFLAVAAVGAVPSTIAWLVFLRPYPTFWGIISTAACAVSLTAPVALGMFVAGHFSAATAFPFLRILMAPFLMGGGLLAGLSATGNGCRTALLAAAVAEAATFGLWVVILMVRSY